MRLFLPSNKQNYRKAAEGAKWRKGKWVANEILLFSAFLRALCAFAVKYWRTGLRFRLQPTLKIPPPCIPRSVS